MCTSWPDTAQRAKLASQAGAPYGISGCIRATDGTTLPLAYQRALHPRACYDRNGRYSFNALITCDWNCGIIGITQGCSMAATDSFVQTPEVWHRQPRIYFSPAEYILGDKGMKYTPCRISPFLLPECTTAEHMNFNFQLAQLRVRSQHTIAILKGRWSSLRELRMGIGSDKEFAHETDWVLACCILHNMCQALVESTPESSETEDSATCHASPEDGALQARQSVVQRVRTFIRTAGTCREPTE